MARIEKSIEVSAPVREVYKLWRPTPLFRARRLVLGLFGLLEVDPDRQLLLEDLRRKGYRVRRDLFLAGKATLDLKAKEIGLDLDGPALTGIDHAGVAAMQQLVEVVLRLAVAAGIADQVADSALVVLGHDPHGISDMR